jgi:hypothetical protein
MNEFITQVLVGYLKLKEENGEQQQTRQGQIKEGEKWTKLSQYGSTVDDNEVLYVQNKEKKIEYSMSN